MSADGGSAAVSALTKERIGESVQRRSGDDDAAVDTALEELLAAPLSMEAAVRLALLNNSNLQASFAELGVAESDLVLAGRLRNPGLSFPGCATATMSRSNAASCSIWSGS